MSGPKTNGGIVWSNPITVILKADPVSSYTNHSRATLFMLSPIWETACPENRRPKLLVLSNSHPDPARPSIALSMSVTAKSPLLFNRPAGWKPLVEYYTSSSHALSRRKQIWFTYPEPVILPDKSRYLVVPCGRPEQTPSGLPPPQDVPIQGFSR